MDLVKFVEDSLWKILLGSFLNTVTHILNVLKDRLQILLLMLSKFKRIN